MIIKFIPKNAGMTKQQIWEFFYEKRASGRVFCYGDGSLTRKPAFTVDQMSDKLCQEFVDKEYDLREEMVDEDEEDLVAARDVIVGEYFHKFKRAASVAKS